MSTASDARQAAATIRALLAKAQRGDLDAPPGMVRGLRGALAALEALTRRGAR